MNTEPCLKNMAWKLTNVISFDSHGQLLQSYFSTLPVFLRSGPEVIYRVLLQSTSKPKVHVYKAIFHPFIWQYSAKNH